MLWPDVQIHRQRILYLLETRLQIDEVAMRDKLILEASMEELDLFHRLLDHCAGVYIRRQKHALHALKQLAVELQEPNFEHPCQILEHVGTLRPFIHFIVLWLKLAHVVVNVFLIQLADMRRHWTAVHSFRLFLCFFEKVFTVQLLHLLEVPLQRNCF